jgi:CHAT domain-containing protein
MKKTLQALTAGCLLFGLTGCFSLKGEIWSLGQRGRYEELAAYVESHPGILSQRSTLNEEIPLVCKAYYELKRYNKLFACLEEMGRLEYLDEYYRTWQYLLRADALLDFGDTKKAVEQASKAYEISSKPTFFLPEPFNRARVEALSLLALASALNGDRATAEARAGEFNGVLTTEIRREQEEFDRKGFSLNDDQIKVVRLGRAAFTLAGTYLALGKFRKCLEYSRMGEESVGGARRTFLYASSWLLGGGEIGEVVDVAELSFRYLESKCAYEVGEATAAKQGYKKLLNYSRIQENGNLYWPILFDMGKIADDEGNRKEAIEFYKKAVQVIEQQRSTINTEASRIGFVGGKQVVYHRLVAMLMADGQPAQAFEYVERAKARALVDLLASKQDFATSGVAPQQVAALVKDLGQVEEDSFTLAASSEESGRRSARGVQVRANIRTASPELASLVMVTETASSAVQALLEPDETLLEYYYQGDDLYAFVVTRDRVQGVKLNGAKLANEVEAFRKVLEDPKSDRVGESSRNLYARLIQPVAAQVGTKRLLVVGHGVLHYLPFAALSDGSGHLVDRYSLRLLPSASVLQFLKGRQAQKDGGLLAFGNPDLGDPQYDLKFAQDEVQAIAKTFPQAKVLVRQEATKSAFRSLGPQFSYLHLATHGKFDPDAPLKSGLLLAKDPQGDGFLSLGDLYSLRLNADLVTLSACETGLGKVNNGDDVVGLIRGFLYAGSNSIVASLWEVDDRATSLLMAEFYANLKKTDKREALRRAQLTAKQQFPHPFFWAAFQLTGLP